MSPRALPGSDLPRLRLVPSDLSASSHLHLAMDMFNYLDLNTPDPPLFSNHLSLVHHVCCSDH